MLDKTVRDFLCTYTGKLAIAFLIAACAAGFAIDHATRPLAFDSETWKQEEGERYRMIRDLLDSRQLDALTEAEVKHLLGEPQTLREDTLLYWVAPADSTKYWLRLTMKDGHVADVDYAPD